MKNTKISINKDIPEKAGNLSLGEDTAASAIVRERLQQIAKRGDRLEEVIAELRKLSETSRAELGPSYKFNREDSYER